jgi:pimeloyl-ACP methyl ester carboxylesterase
MLPGGPGGDSTRLEESMYKLSQQVSKNFAIYTTDHRGVGRSGRLSCTSSQGETVGSEGGVTITQNEYKECVKDLRPHHTSVDGAYDVFELIKRVHGMPGISKQYLYGLSYGTMWVTRIMQIPDVEKFISGIFLDGVVSTYGHANTFTTVDQIDEKSNQVGFKFLERNCAKDSLCSSKLRNNPKQFALDLLEKLNKGHCLSKLEKSYDGLHTKGIQVSVNDVKALLSNFLYTTREYIPVLLYRLDRCSLTEDIEVLQYFFKGNNMTARNCTGGFAPMLYNHIALSEMYSVVEPSLVQLETIYNTSLFATGETLESYALKQYWPVYKPNPLFYNLTFTTSIPVALVNGDLDSSTVLEFAQQQYDSIVQTTGHKQLIVIPNAPHFTLENSPTVNDEQTCTMQLLVAFLNDPSSKLVDHKCLQQLKPIPFGGDAKMARKLFSIEIVGGDDVFEASYSEVKPTPEVSVFLLLGIVISTAVTGLVTIALLASYVIETRNKQRVSNY